MLLYTGMPVLPSDSNKVKNKRIIVINKLKENVHKSGKIIQNKVW